MIKDNLEDDKAGMPFEWMGVSKELHIFLDEEVGSGISDQLIYINDMLAEMYQMNPTGVMTFDPLNEEPDEALNASKTQGTPPGAQEARPKDKAATPDNGAGRDKEGVHYNKRQPSDRATADGGRTSSTVANSSTSSSRQRGAAKRATTRRDNLTYTQSLEAGGGQQLGQQDNACFWKRKSQLNYMDIRKIWINGRSNRRKVC
jgi:hypothetical protein